MKSTVALPLVLLLSLTTSSLSAPIPVAVEECSHYASCRYYRQRPSTQPESSLPLQEPHSPTHRLEPSKHTDQVEVRLLQHHITTPTLPIQLETPAKNPKLNAILQAASKDEVSTKKKLHELGHKLASTETTGIEPPVQKSQSSSLNSAKGNIHGFTASTIKNLRLVAAAGGHKCGKISETHLAKDEYTDGRMTITYAYGYSYMRRDYTSVLVVSIVVIFMLAIILVELLDKVIEATKDLLGLDEGAIRLENRDCERGDICPPHTYTPKVFRLMPAPPPRSARSIPQPQSTQADVSEEKNEGLYSEES